MPSWRRRRRCPNAMAPVNARVPCRWVPRWAIAPPNSITHVAAVMCKAAAPPRTARTARPHRLHRAVAPRSGGSERRHRWRAWGWRSVIPPAVPVVKQALFVVAVTIAHAVCEPCLRARWRTSFCVFVLQFARGCASQPREHTSKQTAGFVIPWFGALQSDPVHNGLNRRSPGIVWVDDVKELHCATRVAPIKVRIEQALFRAVHDVIKYGGRGTGSSSDQAGKSRLRRSNEHDSRVEPGATEAPFRCETVQTKHAVCRAE
eukprot:scaffold15742_cov71-Phaeocystis_antarctica.AAC.5